MRVGRDEAMGTEITELFQPVHTLIGKGSIQEMPRYIAKLGVKKALAVTDQQLCNIGTVAKITDVLEQNHLPYVLYNRVQPNPTVAIVNEATQFFEQNGCDYIIGIGGGSPIDVAKAVSILSANGGKIEDYDGYDRSKKAGSPVIAVNTTAGTGSEVTRAYVVTDEVRKAKMLMVDGNSLAYLAIDDPELMIDMPPALTAATGMDALTHAIEAFVATGHNPYTDGVAIEAIRLVWKSLRKAVANGHDMQARTDMCWAEYMAGYAFSNAGLGLVHAIAHQLGGFYHTPHGVANAIMLPHCMEFNRPYCAKRMAQIAAAFDIDIRSMSEEEASFAAVKAVKRLSRDINIPYLTDTEFRLEDASMLAENALKDTSMLTNPVKPSKEQIVEALVKAYSEGLVHQVFRQCGAVK